MWHKNTIFFLPLCCLSVTLLAGGQDVIHCPLAKPERTLVLKCRFTEQQQQYVKGECAKGLWLNVRILECADFVR